MPDLHPFFLHDHAPPLIYTLSLHDALPIYIIKLRCNWIANNKEKAMMTRTLDSVKFDMPPTAGQIMELADLHRKKLDEAIISKHTHLDDHGLTQRKEVDDFHRGLYEHQGERVNK